jgi:hypothetical protein
VTAQVVIENVEIGIADKDQSTASRTTKIKNSTEFKHQPINPNNQVKYEQYLTMTKWSLPCDMCRQDSFYTLE